MTRLTATIPAAANARPPNAFAEIKRDLDALETALRDEMGAEDSPPNVGLLPSAGQAETVVSRFLTLRGDRAGGLVRVIKSWPAVGVSALSSLVRRTLGTEVGNEMYRHLDAWIGEKTTANDHSAINTAFRDACRRLGLPLPPNQQRIRRSLINDYVLQAGVTDHMMAVMLEAFWRTRTVEGLPDPEIATECARWSRLACDRLASQKRLLLVLGSDATGHYAAEFARANSGGAVRGFAARIRRELPGAEAAALRNAFDAAEPILRFEDGDLRVVLPEVEGCRWSLTFVDETISINAAERASQDIPGTIPATVAWTLTAPNKRQRRGAMPVLADGDAEPEFLLFDEENGALVVRAKASEARVEVTKGPYRAISRDTLRVGTDEGYALRAGIQAIDLDVEREPLSVVCGGRSFVLEPTDEPRVRFSGPRLLDVRGQPLHIQDGLCVDIDLPSDAEGAWEIALAPGAKRVALPAGSKGRVRVDLAPHLDRRPEIVRVRAGLVPAGGARPIATARTLAILGATGVNHGRVRGVVPANIDPNRSHHILFGPDGWGVSLAEALTDGTLVVNPDRSGTIPKPLELRLPRSGTRVRHIWHDEAGGQVEQALRLGGVLAVSAQTPGFIEIRCDDPWSEILVGGESRGKAFLRRSSIRISAASLYDLARRTEAEIMRIGADDEREMVLRAVLPAEPHGLIVQESEDGRLVASFSLSGDVNGIRVRTTDLYADTIAAADLEVAACREPAVGHTQRFTVAIPPDGWNGAACVCHVEIRLDGEDRWRRLSSPRHGEVLLGHPGDPDLVPARFPDGLLERVLRIADTPIMDACGPHLRWLDSVVDVAMLAAWRRSSPQEIALLLDRIFPQKVHAVRPLAGPGRLFCALPHPFAEDLSYLRHAEIASDPTIDVLRVAADMREADDVASFVEDGRLDGAFLKEFDGWAPCATDELRMNGLGAFRLSAYASALEAAPADCVFDPRRDPLLGPKHFAWAVARAAEALTDAPPEPRRLGLAVAMAADLACNLRRAEHALLCDCTPERVQRLPLFPAKALDRLPLLDGLLGLPEVDPDQRWTEWREHGLGILPTFAAYAAFCARGEPHRPWLVGGLIERVRRNGRPALDALDAVFDQGRDLFAFFVLMWEIVFKERA